ncbi:superoxide dismutase family protein [Nakamurella sp. GG22]
MTTIMRSIRGVAVTAAIAGVFLTACSSETGNTGSESAASLTAGESSEAPATSTVGGNNAPATGTNLSPASGTTSTSGTSGPGGTTGSAGDVVATAGLVSPAGAPIGTVEFSVNGTVVTVTANVEGLPAGFKGFHIHAIGKCEPNSANPTDASKVGDFLSAGGHLGAAGADHPGHQGDLTSLQVRQDGSAQLTTTTDAFDVDALLDADGSAVMVHAGPDNFGNVPTRYAPSGPDADTQATGDSGGRAACGVITAVSG